MYTKGRLITVQGHPEFNGEIVADITQSRYEQGLFTQQDYDDAMSRVHLPHHGAQCAYVFIKFLLHG